MKKTINLGKLDMLSTSELEEATITLVASLYGRCQLQLEKSIIIGQAAWEANDRQRRDTCLRCLESLRAIPQRGGWTQ